MHRFVGLHSSAASYRFRFHTVITRSHNRKAKDPRDYGSIDDLRNEIEQSNQRGLITGLIELLGGRTFQSWIPRLGFDRDKGPDEYEELLAIEASLNPALILSLQHIILTTKWGALKIIKKYPRIVDMDRNQLTLRLVSMKSLFPKSDVARMVELAPDEFLGQNDWTIVENQIECAAEVLREGLVGADVDFLFQEDPLLLFENTEHLEVGVKELRSLWDVDEDALAASDSLELGLAVRALGPQGPPRGF